MEQRIGIERMEEAINLFGSFDENIRLLESELQVVVTNREGEICISGEPENVMLGTKAEQALLTLSAARATSGTMTTRPNTTTSCWALRPTAPRATTITTPSAATSSMAGI